MKFKIFLAFAAFTLIISCKNEPKTSSEVATTAPSPTPKVLNSPVIDSSLMNSLKQEKPLSAYATQFYTNLLWHYSAAMVIKDTEKQNAYNGKWIKLKPDHSIETGHYDDGQVYSGSWAVDEAKNIITIVEDGERPTYSEWKIKTSSNSDAVMIWVGTRRFGLNNTQIKMTRNNVKPIR